jgi:hypothetical protein
VRRIYILLIVVGAIAFLAVAALFARVYSTDNAETSAITELIRAQARGDLKSALDQVHGCRSSPTCTARVADDVARLRQPGRIVILALKHSTGFSVGSSVGTARVAWKSPSSLPIVQCVRVRRAGDALKGLRIELLAISPRIKSDASCPANF